MNRDQRRHARTEQLGMVRLRDIAWPWELSDDQCAGMLADRLMLNLLETGHPFHHKTANGVIVEPDPTQEYYLSRLSAEKQEHIRQGWMTRVKPDAPNAVAVNRKYYGHDPFERHEARR